MRCAKCGALVDATYSECPKCQSRVFESDPPAAPGMLIVVGAGSVAEVRGLQAELVLLNDQGQPDPAARIAAKLRELIPGLEHSRETHRQWRDCDQKWRDLNPDIGTPEQHQAQFDQYETRIRVILEAAEFLERGTAAAF